VATGSLKNCNDPITFPLLSLKRAVSSPGYGDGILAHPRIESRMLSQFKHLRRVVITGMGCVTPIGIGREAFWSALQRGESGVRRIESFDVSNSPVKIAAQVRDFEWEAQLVAKDRKHVPRTVPLALASARD